MLSCQILPETQAVPLSRNFHVRTHVYFTYVNKILVMYELPRVNVEVERGSTFTIMRCLSYIAYVRKNNATVEIYPNKHFIPFKGG